MAYRDALGSVEIYSLANAMSLKKLYEEHQYRLSERLGILCEDRVPTPEQMAIAEREAQEWLAETTREPSPAKQLKMNL